MPDSTTPPVRARLRQLYDLAVERAHPRHCLPPFLPLPARGERLLILGAGKAAAAMAVAAEAEYADLADDEISGSLVTRHGFGLPTDRLELTLAGHPVPDAGSISAAARALELAAAADAATRIVVLLSGGASALWSAPVAPLTFATKQDLTKDLLRCGARITEINCVRRHLSRIKGGKLAAAAKGARSILTLAISDVPGDLPESIGSGPTVADPTTLADALAVLAHYKLTPAPEVLAALADSANETLKPTSPALANAEYRIVAAPKQSLTAAADLARGMGYRVLMLSDALEGEAREVARGHAQMALGAAERGERIAILSGGELTVTVTGTGRGGPNQEYALALAIALEGTRGISAIAGDTDGIDGGGGDADDPAGALVLPDTLARAQALALNPAQFLANNDSTAFFRRLGDLLEPGPTQTNVNDFRAILVDP